MRSWKKLPEIFSRPLNGRFAIWFALLGLYIVISFTTRIIFLIWAAKDLDFNFIYIVRAFFTGFGFDITTGLSFLLLYTIYLLLFPKRWIGTWADRIITYFYVSVILLLIFFSWIAEFPFWDEFGVRFNFIAVDYLIYTYEVISNINESYPLPLIIAVLIGLVIGAFVLLNKTGILKNTFSDKRPIRVRAVYVIPMLTVSLMLLRTMKNKQADFSNNLVVNELGKNGVFSFFAAFRSNELDYDMFYPKLKDEEAYTILKKMLLQENQRYASAQWYNISRITKGADEIRPNIILVAIESFSGDFLKAFGNKDNLTPYYDSLTNKSIFFTNLYATGTRTVRGMEALTLCVPPTPGNSIVRRPHNDHIFSIATILKQKGYHSYFIYGGDGYFDNMNNFFAGQGFDIVDRDRGNPLSDPIGTHRYNIPDNEVHFENAWGVCDEDLYRQSIKYADKGFEERRPFFEFVMTTSNHKPYTFPDGAINLPKGNRNAAVKYTDYALGKFIAEAQKKTWFKNTVFVIVADHCASSAGKWEINIDKHHIPAIIYNLPCKPQKINRLVSQIDLMPTVFGYLNWSYNTVLYGEDINQTGRGKERAFIANYRTLGLLKGNTFTQMNDRKMVQQFKVSEKDKALSEIKNPNKVETSEAIAYYQTASERFKSGKMKMTH
ncbi:LTA synthase family protein [Niabella insulamsoli]|uniref:LTA synthase family protein n=1 Tax=Niabella insulamsoli TaxID=3144874 RepID=UPI0031FBA872